MPIPQLVATAAATEHDVFAVDTSDPELERLLQATADGFVEHLRRLPPVELSASTAIPRSVGLAGSSALVIAALRTLGGAIGHRWDRLELAQLALGIERDRLGIEAGLQDRLVQAVGRPVAMEFDPVDYEIVDGADELPLYVAWDPTATEPSDTVHRALRRRFEADDPLVRTGMAELAAEARRASAALRRGDHETLARAIDATFDLRRSMVDVEPRQVALVEIGRSAGAAVNSAGSGGSTIGLARDRRHLAELATAHDRAGVPFLAVSDD